MPHRAVIDQTIHQMPLDPIAIAIYLAVFICVAFLTFRRPVWGIAALILLDPFALYRDIGGTTLTLPKIALIGLALGMLVRRPNFQILTRAGTRAILYPLIGVTVVTVATWTQADFAGPAIREALKSAQYLMTFAVVVLAFWDDPDERVVFGAIAGITAVVSLAALAQEVTGAPSGVWFQGHPIPRIAGPLEGPNQLSGYLGIALPVVLSFYLLRWIGVPIWLVLAFGSCAAVLTLSRSGIFTTLAALVIVFACAQSRRTARAIAAIGGGAAVAFGIVGAWGFLTAHSGGTLGRFSSVADVERPGGVGTRTQLWHAAYDLWRQHPILGIGAGNFEFEIGRVGPQGIRTHANSLYVQSLVEGGVALFVVTLWLLYASIATFVRGPLREPLVLGALAASVGLALHQTLDLLTFFPKVGSWWCVILGLGAARLGIYQTTMQATGGRNVTTGSSRT